MSGPTQLCELAIKYRTDKTPFLTAGDWRTHGYTPYYHDLLGDRRNSIKRVLEIGVAGGGSVRMWADYFPNAEIFGVDINPEYQVNEGRIKSFLCDQSDEAALTALAATLGGNFDLIVEDGSHESPHQVITARALVPFLAPNGIYIIEDLCHPEDVVHKLPFPCQTVDFRLHLLSDDRIEVIRK